LLVSLSADLSDLLFQAHIRNRIAGIKNKYIIGKVKILGFTIPTPIKPITEIKPPRNSHFHATTRPPIIRTPTTILIIGMGSAFGWCSVTDSPIKNNKKRLMIRILIIRAVHRMILIDWVSEDPLFFIIFIYLL
jgi:hypothetical protein